MGLRKKIIRKLLGGLKNGTNSNGHYNLKSIDLAKPHPFQIELQHLYDSLELTIGQEECKVISIASSTHGEGSSTVSAYYALLLATGIIVSTHSNSDNKDIAAKRVMLVDGNLRNPSIHNFFNLKNETGFSELLQDSGEIGQTLNEIEGTNLTVITAGNSFHNPIKTVNAQSLDRVIKLLRASYSYIIIDSAPVLPYLDTLNITKFCNGLVLNIKAETTRREVVQKAKLKMIDSNLNIIGVVLNRRGFYIPGMIYNHL